MLKLAIPILWFLLPAQAYVFDQRGLIEQALDEPAEITLQDVKLSEAFEIVTSQTGVEVSLHPDALFLIPHGAETRVNARIANKSLREGLHDLVSPLGMTFIVLDDRVEIVPKPALLCLGRPATWEEIDLLNELSALHPGTEENDLAGLRQRVQLQVREPNAWPLLEAAIRNVGAGPGDEVLTVACDNLGWSWCVDDQRVVVVSVEQQIRRQLRHPISVRVSNRPLFDVMRAIGREIGVPVRVEPGALEELPATVRQSFSMNVSQQSAEEAFDTIAAYTGLGYLIDREGVLFYRLGGQASQQVQPATPRDPYVGKLTVSLGGGVTMDWLIRASELPEDLRQRRESDLQRAFEKLRSGADGGE